MANYLLTGAAGFIGARTSELLVQRGHTVTGVDNLNAAYDPRLKEYRLRRLSALPGFTFKKLDIAEKQAVITGLDGQFDGVINLAAWAGVRASVENPWVFVESTILGTVNMLELCRRNSIPKFLLASTSSIYGSNPPYPTPESAPSSAPLQPYAASKKGAEVMAHAYHHLYDIDVTVARFFTVYGPAGRPDLSMFRFTQWISEDRPVHVFGDGEQSRGFTYIDDLAEGIIAGMKPLGFEIVNLGGHEVISINELIRLLEEIVGKKANVQHGLPNPADMLRNWADVGKAKALLGWTPRVKMRDGVRRLVDWYNAERAWAKDIQTI
jgi:nucleoside-diphosphate-sugar epimerase